MTESKKAVFLSYASEDAAAAARICAGLRAFGIQVWFDQNELRGGEEWDARIRKQIKSCALFMPIISVNTQARVEGYFRLEWKLAIDRSHLIAPDQAFLMPVVIDDTPQTNERIPDKFRDIQWTRLPGGEPNSGLLERVAGLLSPKPRHPVSSPVSTERFIGGENHGKRPRRTTRRVAASLLMVAALVLGVIYGVVECTAPKRAATEPGATREGDHYLPATAATIPEKSIAVLPFVDLSEKHDQEYFSDGLAEELLNLLAQVPDLRVSARTSSFYFKGKTDEVGVIAQKLRVAHILEGSVRKAGSTVRVTAQLIRADNGYQLWSKTYDREIKDVFLVQDEIANAVVEALKVKLLPAQDTANSPRTSNSDAYNEYLIGRQFHNRRTDDGYRHAIEAYRKAIALDPGYGAAYAGIAMSEVLLAQSTHDASTIQAAFADAERAIELAPNLADGYATRGFLRYYISWDWSAAQADFVRALALDPGDSSIQVRYSGLLGALGRLPEAIAATKKSTELDPLSIVAWQRLARYYLASGQLEAANAAIQRALEVQPDSVNSLALDGILHLITGRPSDALTIFHKMSGGHLALAGLAMAEHSLGHAKASQDALDQLKKEYSMDSGYTIAQVYSWRNQKDETFQWLEQAYDRHSDAFFNIKVDPILVAIRSDPRYKALLQKLKLPE